MRAEHQLGRGLAGHQRDLGVPPLHRQRRAERELVAVLALLDLLLGDRQRDPAAPLLAFLAEQADLLQQVQRIARRPVVQRALDARVVELLPAADERPADVDLDSLAGRVDLHRPEDGRADLVGQEAAGALGQRRRIEARVPVRRVERLAALVCLDVHRPARGDERGDVGDRVADAVALTAPLEVERLVEVHRLRRVDRDERDRRLVLVGEPRGADGALRIGEHLVRELERDLEALAQLRKRGCDLGRIGCGKADVASHAREPSCARTGRSRGGEARSSAARRPSDRSARGSRRRGRERRVGWRRQGSARRPTRRTSARRGDAAAG